MQCCSAIAELALAPIIACAASTSACLCSWSEILFQPQVRHPPVDLVLRHVIAFSGIRFRRIAIEDVPGADRDLAVTVGHEERGGRAVVDDHAGGDVADFELGRVRRLEADREAEALLSRSMIAATLSDAKMRNNGSSRAR